MATNDRKINIYQARLFSLTGLKERFLDLLVDDLAAVAQAAFFGITGTLHAENLIGLDNSGGGSTFSVDITGAQKVLTGEGKTVDLSQITGVGITESIPFENTGAVTYYVGVKFAEVEWGVENNPQRSDPEYPSLKQTYGEVDNPDSVADNTTYIRLVINGITESGVDHSGRTVRVWLVDPVSPNEAVAFFEGTSAYSSPNNYVDIPYSGADGPLGQDTGVDPPSTTASDYKVFIEGVTWKKNTDLRNDSDYAFIGLITGGTPPTFDTDDQVPVLRVTLDTAYDSTLGGGRGRVIEADAGAVEVNTATTTGDKLRAQLRLERTGNTGNMQFHLQMLMGDEKAIPIAALEPLRDGVALLEEEDVTCSGTVINFTRGPVDLYDLSLRVNPALHLVYLKDTDPGDGAEDGLYLISSIPSLNGMVLRDMDGAVVAFTATTAKCTVLHPACVFSNALPNPLVGTGVLDYWTGFLLTLRDGQENNKYMRVLPEGGGQVLIYDGGASSPAAITDTRPRELIRIDPNVIGTDLEWPMKIRRSVIIRGGEVGSLPQESDYDRDGLRIWDADGDALARDPAFPFCVDYGFPEDVPTFHTWPMAGIEQNGAPIRGHHFRDDFMYHNSKWNSGANAPQHYVAIGTGSGDVVAKTGAAGQKYGTGCVELETGALTGESAILYGPQCCNMDTDFDFRWCFRARLRFDESSLQDFTLVQIGLLGGANAIYFERSGTGYWHLKANGTDVSLTVNQPQSKYQWLSLVIFQSIVFWAIAIKDNSATNYGSGAVAIPSLSGVADVLQPTALIQTTENAAHKMQLGYWEWWDREALYGRFGTSYNLNHP
jgi:hypothetical protein